MYIYIHEIMAKMGNCANVVLLGCIIHTIIIIEVNAKTEQCDTYINNMKSLQQQSTNGTMWSYCDYPNPRTQWSQCGQDSHSWVCDTDALISKEQAYELDQFLIKSFDKTRCRCGDACPKTDDVTPTAHTGHPMAVVLLPDIMVTDLQAAEVVNCSVKRNCEMNFPLVNVTVRQPTDQEIKSALKEFGQHLQKRWKLALCDDDVIVIYLHKYEKLYTVGGNKAMEIISDSTAHAEELAQEYFHKGQIYDGLHKALEKYSEKLRWRINFPLIIGITCVCVIGILIIFAVLFNILYCKKRRQEGASFGQITSELTPVNL